MKLNKKVIQGIAVLLLSCFGIIVSPQLSFAQKNLSIGFYNVENLFDTVDDPYDDDEFTPNGKNQWTEERYREKRERLAKVINTLDVDLLGVCEVENQNVLKDLSTQLKRPYQFILFDSPYSRGVDVGLFYDPCCFKPVHKKAIPFSLIDGEEKGKASRDFLVVVGALQNGKDSLAVIVNHWPSRRNTEPNRLAAAKVVRRVVDSLIKQSPKLAIALIGDFNDGPTDASIQYLLTSGKKNTKLYSPLAPLYNADTSGSHEYQGKWSLLDQIIISEQAYKGVLKYQKNSGEIFRPEWLRFYRRGEKHYSPNRSYVGSKYVGGYSDHFPIRASFTHK